MSRHLGNRKRLRDTRVASGEDLFFRLRSSPIRKAVRSPGWPGPSTSIRQPRPYIFAACWDWKTGSFASLSRFRGACPAPSATPCGRQQHDWRKRVGVEPTIRAAKDRIAGFEDREDHRTPFASVWDYRDQAREVSNAAEWDVRSSAATRSYSAGEVQIS